MEAIEAATNARIRVLPPLVVNQIAAGEVVERPASVVKELLDNALDAGATQIALEFEQGGIELIRVVDDGAGIDADDLPLALAPHATSKVRTADDLVSVGTMGFRGEALASIASVARVTIRSRTTGAVAASAIDAAGDEVSAVRPDAGPTGTSVTVRNLFFNTPARRRFLRTPATEQSHCMDVVRALAASHPAVGFRATCDGRIALDLPRGQTQRERALAILGPELEPRLVEAVFEEASAGITLWGLVGLPDIARPTTRGQRFFVNGRPVRDQTIAHALQEAYRGLIDPGRRPTAMLMLEMDPALVDVNVHPSKTEVRFRDASLAHSAVLRSVREALRAADLTPSWRPDASPARAPEFGAADVPSGLRAGPPSFAEAFASAPGASPGPRLDWGAPAPPPAEPVLAPPPRPVDRVLQIHNSYLVTQDEQGIVIIDQHALHERVMFERIMERLTSGDEARQTLESQALLAPAVVQAPASRLEKIESLRPVLTRLGVEVTLLGPAAAAVQAFPTFLFEKGVDPGEFLSDLLERAESGSLRAADGEEALIHEIVDMMACKAAVKAGDRLSEGELAELVALRERVERGSSCPHGRPTAIRLSIRDLEKRFGRG